MTHPTTPGPREMEEAKRLVFHFKGTDMTSQSVIFTIAQALADQRERDAKVALTFDRTAGEVASRIAAAIRSGGA